VLLRQGHRTETSDTNRALLQQLIQHCNSNSKAAGFCALPQLVKMAKKFCELVEMMVFIPLDKLA